MPHREYSIEELISNDGIFCDGDWIETKDQDPEGEVRLIQLGDIGDGIFIGKSNRFLTLKKAEELKCTFLKKGDILIARMPDPIGRACIFPGSNQPCVTVVDIGIIRPENKIVQNEWLKFKINSPFFRHLIKEYTTGTTRKRISRKNLNKIKFELPDYNNQIKVSKILSKAQQLILARKESILLLDEIVKSKFMAMFGDPQLNTLKWKEKTLPQLVKNEKHAIKRGPFGGSLKKDIFIESGYLVYEQYHAIHNDFSVKRYFISDNKYKELDAFKVVPGDLIVSCSGVTLGRIAEIPSQALPGIINQALLKISLDKNKINSTYFKFLFRHQRIQSILFDLSRGSGIPNFPPMKVINSIKFLTPPLELQNDFSQLVNIADSLKQNLLLSLNELQELSNSLMEFAFNGKLDVSNIPLDKVESLSAFEDKPDLAEASIDAFNKILEKKYRNTPDFSTNELVNNKLKNLELEKELSGTMQLDIDYLKYIIKKDFIGPFKAMTLQEHLIKMQITFSYDRFVDLLFELLKGKKSFLKQLYVEGGSNNVFTSHSIESQDIPGLYLTTSNP